MPLKRKFASNQGKRLHQREGIGLFSYAGGLSEESPKEAPTSSQTSPKSHRGTQPRKPHICPPFAPCFQMFLYFCTVEVSQNTEETPSHLKEIFIFAPF